LRVLGVRLNVRLPCFLRVLSMSSEGTRGRLVRAWKGEERARCVRSARKKRAPGGR